MHNIWSINVDLRELARKAVDYFVRLHKGEKFSERTTIEPITVV
jgi:hypothetical protein